MSNFAPLFCGQFARPQWGRDPGQMSRVASYHLPSAPIVPLGGVTASVGLIVGISALEVNISPLLAALGAVAFVIGMALQGTPSNFASGLIILGYRPFDVGDVINAGGVSGIVDSMNLISTKIRTFDNKVMIVPNSKIAIDTITNASASDKRRVDLVLGIGYDEDVEAGHVLLQSIVKNHPDVLDDQAPVVQLNELAESSVNFICRPFGQR